VESPPSTDLTRFESLRRPLIAFFTKLGCKGDLARDLTQETLLHVLSTSSGYRGESSLKVWIWTIARRVFFDHLRSSRTGRRSGIEVPIEELDGTTVVATAEADPAERALSREVVRLLEEHVAALPPRQRQCILLKARGFSYEEISELEGIGVEAVRTHLREARRRLRDAGAQELLSGRR
jgi:RNA polymerase sigma factor (sigma-70 family)